jgi:uncharacterized membrane protein YkvA (DUF1232 family)
MQKILTLYYALKDSRSPWYAKLTALLSIIYLLSPADIIPDIIPFAGYVDDLVIVPFLMNISSRFLPVEVTRAAGEKAKRNNVKLKWFAALAIVLISALMVLLFYLTTKLLKDVF